MAGLSVGDSKLRDHTVGGGEGLSKMLDVGSWWLKLKCPV